MLTTSIARAYFNLQRLFAQRDVSRAAIAQREDVVRITAQRFGAGLDTKVEVKQAEAALATVRTELAQYDDAIAIARNQIAALVGAGPERGDIDRRGRGAAHAPGDRAAAGDSARPRRRAGPRSSRRAGASKRRGTTSRSRKAMFYPNVNLVAFVGLIVDRLVEAPRCRQRASRGVGPAIHLPIFEGGRLNANLRGREADADLAVSAYNQAVIDAVRDVADALVVDRRARRASPPSRRAHARRRPTPTTSP